MNAYDYLIWRPTDELYHHGIKGQKWGQQNGPPYPLDSSDHSAAEKKAAGGSSSGSDSTSTKTSLKDRILKKSSSSSNKSSDDKKKENTTEKKTNVNKSVKKMSDTELSDAIKRLENEQKYKDLSNPKTRSIIKLGEEVLSSTAKNILVSSVSNIGTQTATYVLGVKANEKLNTFNEKHGIEDKQSINPKKGQKDKGK